MKTIITIKGMHCNSCKVLIEDVCSEIKGINACNVDFNSGKADIEHDKDIDWNTVKKEIESLADYRVVL